MKRLLQSVAVAALIGASAPAAAAVTWTDWTASTQTGATGTLAGTAVTYTGNVAFVQTGTGINYFNPWPGADVPTAAEMIALGQSGTRTITFATPLADLYMAFVSWNGQSNVTFSSPFTIVASGPGYWGSGTITPNGTMTGFSSPGEFHGTLKFAGPISSLTFTSSSEYWHGFTLGTSGLAGAVPEPATWAMMILGMGAVGAGMRRRQRTTVRYA